MVISTQPN